jgi:sodium pump decarboxylase gamma subunit
MATAGTNVLIGMGVVFVALIVISFIIYLLKPVSDLIENGFKKKVAPVQVVPTPRNEQIEEVNIDNETELVAVITAAIMASYEEKSYKPDGLVVRRIRKIK